MTILSLIINDAKYLKKCTHFFYHILIMLIGFAILYKTQYVFNGNIYMLYQMDCCGEKKGFSLTKSSVIRNE